MIRHLALAVIERAVRDSRSTDHNLRRTARRFIISDGLGYWCAAAEVSPERVRRAALDGQTTTSSSR